MLTPTPRPPFCSPPSVSGPARVYNGSNILRYTLYFRELDLYKYQANIRVNATYKMEP